MKRGCHCEERPERSDGFCRGVEGCDESDELRPRNLQLAPGSQFTIECQTRLCAIPNPVLYCFSFHLISPLDLPLVPCVFHYGDNQMGARGTRNFITETRCTCCPMRYCALAAGVFRTG